MLESELQDYPGSMKRNMCDAQCHSVHFNFLANSHSTIPPGKPVAAIKEISNEVSEDLHLLCHSSIRTRSRGAESANVFRKPAHRSYILTEDASPIWRTRKFSPCRLFRFVELQRRKDGSPRAHPYSIASNPSPSSQKQMGYVPGGDAVKCKRINISVHAPRSMRSTPKRSLTCITQLTPTPSLSIWLGQTHTRSITYFSQQHLPLVRPFETLSSSSSSP